MYVCECSCVCSCVYVDDLVARQFPFLKISVPLFSKKWPFLVAFVISCLVLGPVRNLTAPIPGIVVAFLSPSVMIEIGVSLSCLSESAANAAIHLLFLPMLLNFCLARSDRVSPIGHLCFLLHLYTAFFVRPDAQMRNFCECNFLHCGIAVPQNFYVFWQFLFVESCVLLTLHPVLLHPFLSNALVRLSSFYKTPCLLSWSLSRFFCCRHPASG